MARSAPSPATFLANDLVANTIWRETAITIIQERLFGCIRGEPTAVHLLYL
jgi:hypothetical protein